MSTINYVRGDATNPIGDGKKIICHICNDIGAWGAGFVMALSKKWTQPELDYRSLKSNDRMLGKAYVVIVDEDIMVANMIAQRDIKPNENGQPPIRYGAVRACLTEVNDIAFRSGATLHMPRIGCGLAGGNWNEIEAIVRDTMSVDVYVYDL